MQPHALNHMYLPMCTITSKCHLRDCGPSLLRITLCSYKLITELIPMANFRRQLLMNLMNAMQPIRAVNCGCNLSVRKSLKLSREPQ